jgi:hypothetical protein
MFGKKCYPIGGVRYPVDPIQPIQPIKTGPVGVHNPIDPLPPGEFGGRPSFLGPPVRAGLNGLGCGCDDNGGQPVNVETNASLEIPKGLLWGAVIFGVLFLLKK